MRNSAVIVRFIAYSVFGCLLLIIYQIVFMARTSANRDWNHLHSMKFTVAEAQRFVLGNATEARTVDLEQIDWPAYFKRSSSVKPYSYVAEVESDNAGPVAVSNLSPLFAFPKKTIPKKDPILTYNASDLLICHHLESSIDDLIAAARNASKQAIVLETNPDWIPNLGFVEPSVPIIAVDGPIPLIDPFPFSSSVFEVDPFEPAAKIIVELASKARESTMEYTIEGFTTDTIIIGDSRGTAESTALFLEVARVFNSLTRLGWRPLRQLKFVSFAGFSAPKWAHEHQSLLKNHGVAYLDCGKIPQKEERATSTNDDAHSLFTASPLLLDLAEWAVHQLAAGGELTDSVVEDYFGFSHHNNTIPNFYASSFGGNSFLFDYGVSSISTDFPRTRNAAQFLSLIAVTLSQTPVLPLTTHRYASFLNETGCDENAQEFSRVSREFDAAVSVLEERFSEEFPWYQFKAKFAALWERKRKNLIMQLFESGIQLKGKHPLFESDKMQTGTALRNTCCSDLVPFLSQLSNRVQI